MTDEVPSDEELNPVLPEEEAAAQAEEEAALAENAEPNTWSDPAYQELLGTSVDIGDAESTTPGITSFSSEESVLTVKGTGAITQQSDQGHFAYHKVSGNWDLKVFVEDFTGVDVIHKAGIMARKSLTKGSAHFSTVVTGAGQVQNLYREQSNGYVKTDAKSESYCESCSSGKIHISGIDCSGFYYCVWGNVGAFKKCPAGTLYDSNLMVCNWASNVQCKCSAATSEAVDTRLIPIDTNGVWLRIKKS